MSDVWTIERHLEAASDRGRDLFHRFLALVAVCGEYQSVHHFRVESPEQLNEEFGRWIAYDQVGCGSRLARG